MSKKSKKIVWFSRHRILASQKKELKRLFGDEVAIIPDPNPFDGAEDVVSRFRAADGDEMVIVAPLSVIGRVCELGIKPLWAEMQVCRPKESEVASRGRYSRIRYYRFLGFKRIKRVALEFEEIEGGKQNET